MVQFKQPLTSTSSATDTVAVLCTVEDVDMTSLIAHVIDQIGVRRNVSIKVLPGKPVAYPATGERWVISREYGDWMFVASVNVAPTSPPHFLDGGTKTGTFSAVAGTMYSINLAASLGSVTVQLPTAPAQGTCIAFTRLDSNFFTSFPLVTVGGADTIDGGSAFNLGAGSVTMGYQGTRWSVLSYGTGGFGAKSGVSSSATFSPNVMARDGSGNTEVATPTASLHAANKAYVDAMLPSGVVWQYAGSSAPTGWLLCDGSSQLRASFPNLFAAIGTTYGSVDGTHFNLPDFTNKFARGNAPGTGAGADAHTHTSAAHTHTSAAHSHALSDNGIAQILVGATVAGRFLTGFSTYTTTGRTAATGTTADTNLSSGAALQGNTDSATPGATGSTTPGATGSSSNIPAYTGVNFIIKT